MAEFDNLPRRRDFLTALGATGYSVVVLADDLIGAEPNAATANEIRKTFDRIAPPGSPARRLEGEPNMTLVDLDCDLFVAGGGMSGVCAAVAAARNGARVILVQDRARLGGNASSEVKMHIVGANMHGGRSGWREGGLIEEFRIDDAVNNPQRSWELWDLLLYDKVVSEPNITLLLDSVLYAAQVRDGRIEQVMVRSDKTEHLYRIKAKLFADCTGDARLALESGATFRWGAEARSVFDEPLAPVDPNEKTMGSSILFTSRDYGRPMPFTPPKWARKVEKRHLEFRGVRSWDYGYWWIEWGGNLNTIRDNERIRHELLAIVMGVWDYIKNSGACPDSANWAMDWVGMVPGKRESRRIEGDAVLNQNDIMFMGKGRSFEDAVAIGGWSLDDHPPGGFDESDKRPATQIRTPIFGIPLRSLYSKNITNLLMAGRNASCSRVAFTSTRVMATCSVMGQAMGTAAAMCVRHGLSPRELYQDKKRLQTLQQTLLRDDQSIVGVKNEDPADVARKARVTASGLHESAKAESVIDGHVRDMKGEMKHRWVAPMTEKGAWIELAWEKPQKVSQVQVTFDTGFHRELTLTCSNSLSKRMIRAPQPETVRDYSVEVRTTEGEWLEVAEVKGNHQRLRRHRFEARETGAVRIHISATNGSKEARIYEVRCYA